MTTNHKLLFVIIAIVLASHVSFALTNITSIPFTISTPDTYVLTGDLTNGTPTAITVTSDNVTLDCQGHSLTGLYTNSTQGVVQANTNNFTLMNCIISEYGVNFFSSGGNNTVIQNNTFDNASQSGVQVCTSFQCFNWSVIENTVQDSFNNGWEQYRCDDNCVIDNNTFKGQLLGHGTDRGFQIVANINNLIFTHNYITNNTFAFRSDNNNMTNVLIAHNNFTGNLNGVNEQGQVGTYSNVTYLNNTIASTNGNDWSWGGISTTVNFCDQTIVENNTASGFPYLWFNSSYSNTAVANLNIGTFAVCNADNFNMTNITTQSALGTVNNEFMQASNLVINGLSCTNSRVCLRALTVNDSMFSNIVSLNGNTLSNINFLGGQDNRNVVDGFLLNNSGGLLSVALGGNNNTIRNGVITNSLPTTGVIGYQSSTVGTGNLYQNISMYNVSIGIIFTLSSNNSLENIYIENATTGVLVNSTASGTKTVQMTNITLANASGTDPVSFDLFDTISPNELYIMNWAVDPGGMNTSYQSFHNKYLHTDDNGATNVSFDQFNMSWSDSDLIGYNENQISWWYYSGTWNQLVATPDLANNKLSYSAYTLSPGDKFTNALFFIDDCQVINASGIYYQHRNYVNATNPSAPYLDWNCIDIRAVPDVVWDCQGFNITNMGTPNTTIGILAANSNVTVRNCNIANYSYNQYSTGSPVYAINNTYTGNNADVGLSFFSSSGSQVINNTFRNQGYGVLFFFGTDNANVSGNQFITNNIRAIDGGTTTGSNFEFNTFTGDNVGIALLNANTDNITSNNFTNIAFIGVQLVGTDISNVINNIFQLNSYAIDMSSGSDFNHINSNIVNFTVFGSGISISQSTGNQITFNNVTSGTTNGISTDANSFSNTISNNIANFNTQIGIRIEGHDEIISSNTMLNNSQPGFAAFNAYNLLVTNNTANGNSAGFRYLNSTNSNSSFNTAIANSPDGGFGVNGNGGLSSGITFTNDTAINNSDSGFQFDTDTDNNTIINCISHGSFGMFGAGVALAGNHGVVNGCTITNSSLTGVIVDGNNSIVQNSQISGNNPTNNDPGIGFFPGGITLYNANSATITGNNILNNPTGIGNYLSTGISTASNTIHSNSFVGTASIDSSFISQSDHFYGNTLVDIFTNNTLPNTITLTSVIFDNPAGNLVNATTLSLSDNVDAGESYTLSYANNNDPTITGNLSVENATVQLISRGLGAMFINSMTWAYNPGSLNSSVENTIRTWTFDGTTWVARNSTLNPAGNTATLTGVSNSANYTLLYDPNGTPIPPPGPVIIGTGSTGGGNSIYVQQPDGSIIAYIQQPVLNTLGNLSNVSVPLPLVNVTIPAVYLPSSSDTVYAASVGQYLCGGVALLGLVALVFVYRFMKKIFNYALMFVLLMLLVAATVIALRLI